MPWENTHTRKRDLLIFFRKQKAKYTIFVFASESPSLPLWMPFSMYCLMQFQAKAKKNIELHHKRTKNKSNKSVVFNTLNSYECQKHKSNVHHHTVSTCLMFEHENIEKDKKKQNPIINSRWVCAKFPNSYCSMSIHTCCIGIYLMLLFANSKFSSRITWSSFLFSFFSSHVFVSLSFFAHIDIDSIWFEV